MVAPAPAESSQPPAVIHRADVAWALVIALVTINLVGGVWAVVQHRRTSGAAIQGPPQFTTDINSASSAELALLPGIGPKLADRIVQQRRHSGPLESLEDLQQVHGIGPKTASRLEPMVVFRIAGHRRPASAAD